MAPVRATHKHAYWAADVYVKCLQRSPLKQVRKCLAKVFSPKHLLKVSFVKASLRLTVWKESLQTVQSSLRTHHLRVIQVDPCAAQLSAVAKGETRSEETLRTISSNRHETHRDEVSLILALRIARRERQGEEKVSLALGRLQSFRAKKTLFARPGTGADQRYSKAAENAEAGHQSRDSLSGNEEASAHTHAVPAILPSEDERCMPLQLDKPVLESAAANPKVYGQEDAACRSLSGLSQNIQRSNQDLCKMAFELVEASEVYVQGHSPEEPLTTPLLVALAGEHKSCRRGCGSSTVPPAPTVVLSSRSSLHSSRGCSGAMRR